MLWTHLCIHPKNQGLLWKTRFLSNSLTCSISNSDTDFVAALAPQCSAELCTGVHTVQAAAGKGQGLCWGSVPVNMLCFGLGSRHGRHSLKHGFPFTSPSNQEDTVVFLNYFFFLVLHKIRIITAKNAVVHYWAHWQLQAEKPHLTVASSRMEKGMALLHIIDHPQVNLHLAQLYSHVGKMRSTTKERNHCNNIL